MSVSIHRHVSQRIETIGLLELRLDAQIDTYYVCVIWFESCRNGDWIL